MKRICTIPALLLLDGLIAVIFAVFAHTLGIDPNPGWGRSRFVIFLLGFLTVGISISLHRRAPEFTKKETVETFFLFGHIWAVIIVIYIWFITFGTFTEWRASTHYYSLLADAFGKGQLNVDVEPGAALLTADDPYNSEGRPAFNDDVWDLSLYNGKLYLYWGPVPALFLTPVQLALKTSLSDMYLVFLFLCGLLVINSLIIIKSWHLFFTDVPAQNVAASILVIGLILPIPWSLSIPDVYEAAIGAGQFFLMGGIYFVLLAFGKTSPSQSPAMERYLLLAGLFWACSVGSRAINIISVLFLTALSLYWIRKTRPTSWMHASASLLTPLAMGAILIGWYNYARFDSPLEFGLRYQITIQNMNRDLPLAFQLDYLPYNVLAYVLQPFKLVPGFPFITPVDLSSLLQSRGIITPKLYAAGNVTGILFFAPFLLLAFISFSRKPDESITPASQNQNLLLFLLGGSFLFNFISLLLYYYGQMRFLVDVISQITLLAVFGYWMIVRKPATSRIYLHLANLLILFTLVTSHLLAATSESGRMAKLNPALMDRINSMFNMTE